MTGSTFFVSLHLQTPTNILMASSALKISVDKLGELYAYHWESPNPKAVVALVHGLGEHIHRYQHVAEHLNAAGYSLVAMDLPGHGNSPGKRGHLESYSQLMDAWEALLAQTKTIYPDLPVFLYGHSMGGNITLSFLLKRKPDVAGCVLSAPWIQLAFQPNPGSLLLLTIARKVYPSLTQPNNLNTHDLSRDAAVVEAYEADPLVHSKITPGLAGPVLDAAARLNRYHGEIPVPLLIMHGTADRITSAPASVAFCERVGGDATFKGWDGFYHEIHNEPEKQQMLNYLVNWLDVRLDAHKHDLKSPEL